MKTHGDENTHNNLWVLEIKTWYWCFNLRIRVLVWTNFRDDYWRLCVHSSRSHTCMYLRTFLNIEFIYFPYSSNIWQFHMYQFVNSDINDMRWRILKGFDIKHYDFQFHFISINAFVMLLLCDKILTICTLFHEKCSIWFYSKSPWRYKWLSSTHTRLYMMN